MPPPPLLNEPELWLERSIDVDGREVIVDRSERTVIVERSGRELNVERSGRACDVDGRMSVDGRLPPVVLLWSR